MLDAMRFWLDRGVDGFRVDVIWHLIKDDLYRDNPQDPAYQPGMAPHRALLATYTADRPEVHEIIARMRSLLDGYPERLLIGEIYLPIERLVTYYGATGEGAHLPYNFQLILLPWNARVVAEAVNGYEAALPAFGWPNWVLGNHDKSRIATRLGSAQARVAALLLLTLRGTPTLYYGDELGMQDVPIPPDLVQDPFEKNVPGMGFGRDPERTPMQWSAALHGGFSTVAPWLPVAENVETVNVDAERASPDSMLWLYRRAIELRRREPALAVGAYEFVAQRGDVFAYARSHGGDRFLVALNLGPEAGALPEVTVRGSVVLATQVDREGEAVSGSLALRGDEGLVIRV
jgi:alpha-glucosidase